MALTDAAIRALLPKDKRYYVTDGRGLCVEVFPSGAITWRYRYRLNGNLEKVALGKYPALSLKAARQKRDELATAVALGNSPAKDKQTRKHSTPDCTVREFGEKYFHEVVERNVKDPKNVQRWLDKEIYPVLGGQRVSEITPDDVKAIVFRKRDNGRPASAAAIRSLLKRIFDYAVVCQVVTLNPANAIPTRFITSARPRTRSLRPSEIRTYLHTLYASNIRTQFKLALHLILLTLVRKSELLLAKWEHIDLGKAEWQVPRENSKTGRPHIVYLSRQAADLLRQLKSLSGNSEWVLPGRSSSRKPFAKNALNQALEGLSFDIDPFTIHDFRRTGSTLLHEKGFSSDVIEKALNHTIGGVRGVYNRAEYGDQRREMLQFWADFVEQVSRTQELRTVRLWNPAMAREEVVNGVA